MYQGLRLFLLSLLLPAFMASAVGMQVTKHVCGQCHLVEFSLDGTASGNCCGKAGAEEAQPVSCCSIPQVDALAGSCCASEKDAPGHGMQLPDEGLSKSTCCQHTLQYLITDTTINTSSLLLVFFKAPLPGKINPLLLTEDDLLIACEQNTSLWKHAGRTLLLSIHQLKLDCLV